MIPRHGWMAVLRGDGRELARGETARAALTAARGRGFNMGDVEAIPAPPPSTSSSTSSTSSATRAKRSVAQARLWDIRQRLEKEWDGADPGIAEDLAALRLAADVLAELDGDAP